MRFKALVNQIGFRIGYDLCIFLSRVRKKFSFSTVFSLWCFSNRENLFLRLISGARFFFGIVIISIAI